MPYTPPRGFGGDRRPTAPPAHRPFPPPASNPPRYTPPPGFGNNPWPTGPGQHVGGGYTPPGGFERGQSRVPPTPPPPRPPTPTGGGGWSPYPHWGNPPWTPPNVPPGANNPVNPAGAPPSTASQDFRTQALLLFPWLGQMPELLAAYVQGYIEYGDPGLAFAVMRNDPAYDRYFAGNRRDDGSFRLTEAEYLSTRDGYASQVADYGLNPDLLAGRFAELIAGDVSVTEFAGRLRSLYNGIFNAGPIVSGEITATMDRYAAYYGVELTPEAVFASFIDPDIGQDILDRRITVSQVGGGAFAFGYDRSRQRVEELMGFGLDTLEESQQFYSAAAQRLPRDTVFARRFNDPYQVDVGTLESAYITGGWADRYRLERNTRSELLSFSDRRTAQQDQQGNVIGLVDR